MNHRTGYKALLAMLVMAALTFTACATVMPKKTGVQRSERAITSMQDVENDMKQASTQIDVTKASLDDLVRTGQSPSAQPSIVKSSFDGYRDNVAKMDDMAKRLNKDIDTMNSDANAYFEQWSKEGAAYTDPKIQKLSEERRIRLSRDFSDIASSSAGMRGSLNSYVSELKQIQSYLSNDLTAKGIAAIAPSVQAVERSGNNLKTSFRPVQSSIETARVEMTPGGAAAGGGAGAGGLSTGGTGTVQTR